jgi:hypothetical protein
MSEYYIELYAANRVVTSLRQKFHTYNHLCRFIDGWCALVSPHHTLKAFVVQGDSKILLLTKGGDDS